MPKSYIIKANKPILLQINICYGYYSTGKIAEDISELVQTNDWNSFVVYRSDIDVKHTASLLPVGGKIDKFQHFAKSLLLDKHGLGSTNSTRQLIKEIERIKPDIIHLHNIHGYYINIKVLLEFLSEKKYPVVITTHDCWLFTGHCAHFTKIHCEKWKVGCHDCGLLGSYPRALTDNSSSNYKLKKSLFEKFDNLHIVAVSRWLGNTVRQSFLGKHEVRVIHNGVDTDKFKIIDINNTSPLLDFPGKIILGVASAWYEDKGLKDYYKLAEVLPNDVRLCLVGVSEALKKRLPENIIGICKTRNLEELVWLYNRASVVLSLSKAETFGLTIVEGYACGTPAIVYDNTALPELITPETGIIVPNGDIDGVKAAVLEILSHSKDKYSAYCRKLAETKYKKDNRIEEYYQLYREILNSKKT